MITFAPVYVSLFQNPVYGFLTAIVDRYHTAQTGAAASRSSLPDKSTSGPGTAPPSDVNIDDWNIMFGAVTERLLTLFGDGEPTVPSDLPVSQNADRQRHGVLDCVDALERLRKAMTHEPLARRAPGAGGSR